MKTTNLLLTYFLFIAAFYNQAQVVGGRTNSEQSPKVSEATKLTGGGFTGDVNHMTGEYSGSIPLGSVGTPAGLSYSLSLNYVSSFSFSTNMPVLSGVPYGEGWSPSIPTISIETDVFHRFGQQTECDEENSFVASSTNNTSTEFNPEDEGDLYWFSPMISIPGVGAGRAVFKYIDVSDNKCAVFVLNKFDSPVEIRFYGDLWTVKSPDGTVYQFATHLANYRAPHNKRMLYYNHSLTTSIEESEALDALNNGEYNNPDEIQNSIEPKLSYSVWHCDLIYNQNYPLQGIRFDYQKYGEFNYFKEFQQSNYAMVNPSLFNSTTLPYLPDYVAFTDVYLKEIRSYVMDSPLDILELEYRVVNNLADGGNILVPTDPDVTAVDGLYSSEVVYSFGSGGQSFEGWGKYPHNSVNPLSNPIGTYSEIPNESNPYVNAAGQYFRNAVTSSNSISFDHSFIESEFLDNSKFKPGDIYEIRTKVTRPNGEDLQNGNGTIDIALVTKNSDQVVSLGNLTGYISETDYQATRGVEVFSTFNMALKWQMGWQQNAIQTSNFFVMPNIPSSFDGYYLQIGPGNSDLDFSFSDVNLTDANGIPNALNCYPAKYGQRLIKSGATIPSNFGTGHPWSMMVPIYAKMALQSGVLTGSTGNLNDLFKNWYRSAPSPVQTFNNIPTKFDNTVELKEVQIIRYSKNTYMLTGVKQYRINGEYSFDVPVGVIPPNGKKLVAQKHFEYEYHDEWMIKNKDYGSGDLVETDPQQTKRRIILLNSVTEVPVDGDLETANYGLPDPSITLRTFLKYSKVVSTDVTSEMYFNPVKPFAGLNQYVLTEYHDHLGGITKLEYYPAGSQESRISNNYESHSGCNGLQSRKPFGTDRSYTMHMAVKYLMKNDEDDQLNPLVTSTVSNLEELKRWEYVYNLTSLIQNPKEIVLRPLSEGDVAHFRSSFHMDMEVAFSKIRVYEPGLYDEVNDIYLRNYTDYEYHGGQANIYSYPAVFPSIDDYLFYGKLKSSKTYDHNGVLHEERIITYGKTHAFLNGYERPNPWREQIGYYDDLLTRSYEYEDLYKNEVLTLDISMPGGGVSTVTGVNAYSYLDIPAFNGNSGGVKESPKFLEFYFFEMLQPNNPPYLFDSYFVKKISEIVRTYENGLVKQPNSVIPSIPASASKGANPFGTGIVNPITNDPVRDVPIKTAIHEQKNTYVPQLLSQSPLSDSVLYELINEPGIAADKKADVLSVQKGMSNEVWKHLIDRMREYSPENVERILGSQSYISDEILFHLIKTSNIWTNDKIYQQICLKNAYLSDTVIFTLLKATVVPGESLGEILSCQPQFSEKIIEAIISSANLRDAYMVNIFKDQLMTNLLFKKLISSENMFESSVVRLIEQGNTYPSDDVLIFILNIEPKYSLESMRRIFAKSDREIGQLVLDLVDEKYSIRESELIKPLPFLGNPLNQFCSNELIINRIYIENKTEYEYYEADYRGVVVGKPYELLQGHISSIEEQSTFPKNVNLNDYSIGTGIRTIDVLRLKHEPSWQLFSVKNSSPNLPSAFERQEYFYWYDLQNRYDRYWFNFDKENPNLEATIQSYSPELTDTLVTNLAWHQEFQNIGGVPTLPQIDGMERSRIYGNRVLAFQRSTFSKNTRDVKPLMQSEYYNYDRRWEFDDLPTPSETVSYEGASCTNPPPPTGCQDLYDCNDCYSFKYTTQEALLANVPLNYCAWSLDQFGNMVICPIGQMPTAFYPNASEVYCNTGVVDGQSSKVKALQPAAALNNTLMLRSVTIQLDTINNTQDNEFYVKRLDTRNDYVVDFYMGGSKEEDEYGFNNPVKMLMPFDNLTVRTILERNRYLQPELEKNQVDLKTRYYYTISQNIWNVNSNCASEGAYSSTINTDIGLPVRITVGWDRSEGDSLATKYEYNEIGMVKKVIEPSGKFMEYNFDNFWRLIGVKENGNRLLMNNEYHTWNKDNTLTFSERTNQNYVLNRIYNGALIIDTDNDNVVDNQDVIDANNKDKIEFRKGFVDPLGREHSSIKAYSVGNKMFEIHSGMLIRDNWSRTISNHKNHQVIITLGQETPLERTNNDLNAYSGFIYENDPKSRAQRSSNFGVDVNDLHVVRSNYAIANNIFTSCELGLNLRELQLIMGTGSTSAYRFYRTETYDQDNKVSIEYINAIGQKVATLSYSENNTKIVTLFVYDSYGNLTRVINPEKQQSQYHFNMIGQLVKETTVDAGTKAYMYNKQGLVSVMQDELGNGQLVGSTPKPYYRIFKYDDFGRVIAIGRTDQFELETKYPVYNSNYHPLLYETTFVGDGPDLPTTMGNEPFYFDYLYTNISSQDWLAQYKGMVGTYSGGGNLSFSPGTITGFGTQFKLINPIILEKETMYGTDALVNTIGKVVTTHSYNNDGDLIQRIGYSYDVNDNLSQQTIQFHPTNHLGSNPSAPPAGTTTSVISYPTYNYRNSLLEEKVDVDNNGTVDLHYFNEYDVLNRLVAVYAASAQVSDQSEATKLISYIYDDANGLLIEKKQHVEGGATLAEVASINYSFDVRDRLTAISALNAGNQLMNYQLFYDDNSPSYIDISNSTVETVNHHKNWNGNINGSVMQYTFSGATNAVSNFNDPTLYGFRYDGINRLTEADATVGDFIVGGTAQEVLNSYQIGDESMTYDKIGNIKTMLRVLKNVQIQPNDPYIAFDHFNYNYQAGNNRMISVTGLSGSQSRVYTYDANGNMLTDNYKGITSTTIGRTSYTYNMVKNGEAITYLYSASDLRIYKKVVTSSETKEEYYLMDGMGKTIAIKNMQNNSWEYFLSAGEREARLKPLDGLAKFKPDEVQFFAYDHLGNTRITYTPIAGVSGVNLQIDYVADYYPYGKVLREFANGQTERYLTTQHERDGETGLDYRGARYYDNEVARFLSTDPWQAKYPAWSTYNYVMGNPIYFIDPTGKGSESTDVRKNKDGSYTVVNATNDNDNGIYVVGEDGKRTGEKIGYTTKPYDFMYTNDATGEFVFDKTFGGQGELTFNMNNLGITATIYPNEHTEATVYDADFSQLVGFLRRTFIAEVQRQSPATWYGAMSILRDMSANGQSLDVKESFGMHKYTPVLMNGTDYDLPKITTLRALGNYAFGHNLSQVVPAALTKQYAYTQVMPKVGAYNQEHNGGNGYNAGFPYYGEHTYSGSYIYFGYFGKFYK